MPPKHELALGPAVPVDQIAAALARLREELARKNGDPNALRVCTLNLVAFCHDEPRCAEALDVLSSMVSEHPGRLFLVHALPDADSHVLEAHVAVDGVPLGVGVPPTYSELIDLTASGPEVEFLPSVLTALLESDQPACAWWATPPTFGPTWQRMAHVCDRMVVDTAQLDPWDLMRLAAFVKGDDHAALGDLNWARVKPFMALCARFFQSPRVRERCASVAQVEVHHAPPAGAATAVGPAMLGAWVVDRLSACARLARVEVSPRVVLVRSARSDLAPGEVAELVLRGEGAEPLELSVLRPPGSQSAVAEARAGVTGLPPQRQRLHRGVRWLLAQELQTYGRDPLFERALLHAIDILREARR